MIMEDLRWLLSKPISVERGGGGEVEEKAGLGAALPTGAVLGDWRDGQEEQGGHTGDLRERRGMSNGPLEAVNGLFHVALSRARGTRSLEYLMNVIYLVAGKLWHLSASPRRTVRCDRSTV